MSSIKIFGIIGGDKRQIFLAESLLRDGYGVILAGFDKLKGQGFNNLSDVRAAALFSDAVILPLPCVRSDKSLNAPFASQNIYFSDDELDALCKKPVFAGMRERLLRVYPKLENAEVYDYAARDDFAILNALPTAEGAVEIAMREYEGTIFGSRSLVTGFGRIGKVLARMLKSLGSDVTVSARRQSDFAYINTLGCRAVNTETMNSARGYELIFNTVPSLIFDEKLLENTDRTALLIDLASLPGGVDFESARKLGIDAYSAPGLPGKCSPKSAGEIIKKTVFSIIEEVNR